MVPSPLSVDIIYCGINCAFHAVRLICGYAVIDAQPDSLDIVSMHQGISCGALDSVEPISICLPDAVNVDGGNVVCGVHVVYLRLSVVFTRFRVDVLIIHDIV
jgi:hypothetical protein